MLFSGYAIFYQLLVFWKRILELGLDSLYKLIYSWLVSGKKHLLTFQVSEDKFSNLMNSFHLFSIYYILDTLLKAFYT